MIKASRKIYKASSVARKSARDRHVSWSSDISTGDGHGETMVCECEGVSIAEVKYAIKELHVKNLVDLRRRTRVGMGTCQGELCSCRAAGILGEAHGNPPKAKDDLAIFLQERWTGMCPIAWGETVNEIQFTSWIYEGIYGLKPSGN